MIHNYSEYKYFTQEDAKRFAKKPSFKEWICKDESWYIYRYMKLLRRTEYFKNTHHGLLYAIHLILLKRLGFKIRVNITPNSVGPGFRMFHIGDRLSVRKDVVIGKKCTVQQGVIFCKKGNGIEPVTVGDNCYLSMGVKVIGSIKIGNNVMIAPNSVVVKDIPDNVIASGIPCKILKYIRDDEVDWL